MIHGSDSVESAQKELALWFSEGLVDNNPAMRGWVSAAHRRSVRGLGALAARDAGFLGSSGCTANRPLAAAASGGLW